jgi:ABC-type sulfate/molybdate transport systems ATPase subunit
VADLAIRDLSVAREGRTVLDGCSADFTGGRRTVLWGRSGSGKSTLLSAIAGLTTPKSGAIAIGGCVLYSSADRIDLRPHERQVGFVFQDLALWPHLSALDHVYLVGRAVGRTRDEARWLLDSVGLGGLGRRRPGQLSGGEQQRLAIARALAGRPSLLLLDEPFSSVDATTKDALYRLLEQISPEVPGPTIYVTHHAEDARRLAERVVKMDAGKLVVTDGPWTEDV